MVGDRRGRRCRGPDRVSDPLERLRNAVRGSVQPVAAPSPEEDYLQQMSPVDTLRLRIMQMAKKRYTPAEASANRQQTMNDFFAVLPGTGNAIAAKDAWEASGRGANALLGGEWRRALGEYGQMGLGVLGTFLGSPTSNLAREAAKGAGSRTNIFAGPMARPNAEPITLLDQTIPGINKNKMYAVYRGDEPLAYISGGIDPADPKTFHIGDVTSAAETEDVINTLGPSTVRQILRAIQERFPGVERIGGYRVSGARAEAENVFIPLTRTKRPDEQQIVRRR